MQRAWNLLNTGLNSHDIANIFLQRNCKLKLKLSLYYVYNIHFIIRGGGSRNFDEPRDIFAPPPSKKYEEWCPLAGWSTDADGTLWRNNIFSGLAAYLDDLFIVKIEEVPSSIGCVFITACTLAVSYYISGRLKCFTTKRSLHKPTLYHDLTSRTKFIDLL